jgi:nucleotide-binding universal stress UspA family protein
VAFHKILCPLCLTAHNDALVRSAIELSRLGDCEVVLVHGWQMPPLAFVEELGSMPMDLVDATYDDAERELDLAMQHCQRMGVRRIEQRMLIGDPAREILQTLRDTAFDLLLLGADHHARLHSSGRKVLHHAGCSVMVLRERIDPSLFRNVLVAIDFSDCSERAIELAAAMASPGGSGVTLVHVRGSDRQEPFRPQNLEHLEQWKAELRTNAEVDVTCIGRPEHTSIHLLDDLLIDRFDLVIIGCETAGPRRRLFGWTADRIVREAPCPVLFAQPRRHAATRLRAIR